MLLESKSIWQHSRVVMSSSMQSMICSVSGLSTKTNLQSLAVPRAFGLSLRLHPRMRNTTPQSTFREFLRCGWRWTPQLASHRRRNRCGHRRVRSSVSCTEVAVHLKVQNSALPCSAHSFSHCSVHVQTTIAHHNMRAAQHELPLVQACAALVFDHDSLLIPSSR